jgi:competence protein ComEC
MHLGLIAGLLLLALRRIGRGHRFAVFVVLTAYVAFVGESISLYRAYLMAGLLYLAYRCERPVTPMETLGTALLLVLLWRPAFVYSVAFQLSFAATAAVLLCVAVLPRRRRSGRLSATAAGIGASIAISAAVQLFLLPLQLRYFDGISVLTPLTTLLFLPAVAAVMVSTTGALLTDAILPGTATWFYELAGFVAVWFERALLAAPAPALLSPPRPAPIVYYCGQAILWCRPAGRFRVPAAIRFTAGAAVSACAFVFG